MTHSCKLNTNQKQQSAESRKICKSLHDCKMWTELLVKRLCNMFLDDRISASLTNLSCQLL